MTGGHAPPPKFLGAILKRQFIGATALAGLSGVIYWLYDRKKSNERADYFRQIENNNFVIEGQKSLPKKEEPLGQFERTYDLKAVVERFAYAHLRKNPSEAPSLLNLKENSK